MLLDDKIGGNIVLVTEQLIAPRGNSARGIAATLRHSQTTGPDVQAHCGAHGESEFHSGVEDELIAHWVFVREFSAHCFLEECAGNTNNISRSRIFSKIVRTGSGGHERASAAVFVGVRCQMNFVGTDCVSDNVYHVSLCRQKGCRLLVY